MEEQDNSHEEELVTEPLPGSGSLLAVAREGLGKSIEEIATELNLSVTQIKAIELDQSEGLPEPTYVRGYIRAYAKLVGLKPEEVLQNYQNPDWQTGSSLNDIPKGIGLAEQDKPSVFTLRRALLLLTLLLAGLFVWYFGLADELLSAKPQAANTSTGGNGQELVASDSAGEQQLNAVNAVVSSNETSSSNGDAGTSGDSDSDASGTNGSEDDAELGNTAAVTTQPENNLVLTFSDTSWVEVKGGANQRLAYRSFSRDDRLELSESDALDILIGNAKVVSAELNGEAYDLTPHLQGNYAKFVIPAPQ